MNRTSTEWYSSPARTLTQGNYLPTGLDVTQNQTSIISQESIRQNAVLDIIKLSGEELGRTTNERRLYLQTAGERFGQVRFLAQAEELRNLQQEITINHIDIDTQSEEVKNAIKTDIISLQAASERLYGSIDPERFEAIIARSRHKAAAIIEQADTTNDVQEAAHRLLSRFPEADPKLVDKHIYKPSKELLEHWKPYVEKKYADFLELIDESTDSYTSADLAGLFENAINVMASSWSLNNAHTWTIQFGKLNINVDQETKTVWIPEDQTYTQERAKALLVHEIGGHLLRNLIGELSGDPLLATDMPGRVGDEEALFVALEQTLTGKTRESGLNYYLTVGLGSGTLTDKPVPHAELESYLLDYLTVDKGLTLTDKQRGAARKNVLRVIRGMPSLTIDGRLYQATYNADIKYAVGQKNAVALLEENRNNPTMLDGVMLGKFAYSQPDQWQYAESHGYKSAAIPSAA